MESFRLLPPRMSDQPAEPISAIVRKTMADLTSAEKRVGRVLLASYPIAGLESVTALAQRANVSSPTVTRFVNRMGFATYGEFRRLLREEVQNQISSPVTLYDQTTAGLTERGILGSAIRTFIDNLQSVLGTVPESEVDGTIDLLSDKRFRLSCTGGRETEVLAQYLASHLHVLRPKVRLIPIGPRPRSDLLVDMGKREVIIAFDYRRYQEDTIRFVKEAASRGAAIVLFTDPWLSPIAEFAAHVIPTPVDSPSAFNSQVAALATVEALLAGVAVRLGTAVRLRIEDIERARTHTTGPSQSEDGPSIR